MSIFLTGGAGRTAIRIGRLLQKAQVPFAMASRSGKPASLPSGLQDVPFATFDFTKPETFGNAFDRSVTNGLATSAMYLIPPHVPDSVAVVNSFIDYAVEKHEVKRFVVLATQGIEQNDMGAGKIWQHLVDIGVEYAIIAPTWFSDNFSSPQYEYYASIQTEGKIFTACEDGKTTFISADDIAALASHLLSPKQAIESGKYDLIGPELLSYDDASDSFLQLSKDDLLTGTTQVAAIFTKVLGREVSHVKQSEEERLSRLVSHGYHENHAKGQIKFESLTAKGLGHSGFPDDTFKRVMGRAPQTMEEWVSTNRESWV